MQRRVLCDSVGSAQPPLTLRCLPPRQANKDMYGKCLVNEKESYYSCSGHHADTTRICPCRHGKAQKSSFWNFARPQRGLFGDQVQDGSIGEVAVADQVAVQAAAVRRQGADV
jgi:hypothetical protein